LNNEYFDIFNFLKTEQQLMAIDGY